jgi:predicted phosphate transport protein (TIGR00153 family)
VRLLPRDGRFFDLFTAVASLNLRQPSCSRNCSDATNRHLVDSIKRLEREADGLTLELVTRLDKTFITPLDREDIHMLASRLDDVLDGIDGIARRTVIFRTDDPPHGVLLLADVMVRTTEQLLSAVQVLEKQKAPVVIRACGEVKKLEEEGDAVYGEWLGRLFDVEKDPVTLMKWKEIYDAMEKTIDKAEDVANVLEVRRHQAFLSAEASSASCSRSSWSLVFDFINGFHDSANSIATVAGTGS